MPGSGKRVVENVSEAVSKSTWTVPEGYVTLYTCQAWEGISVWVNQVRVHNLPVESPEQNILKINYCLDGRCELKIEGEGYFYIFDGQISISSGTVQENYSYPTGKYDGVELLLRFDQMRSGLSDVLSSLGFICREVSPALLAMPSADMKKLLDELATLLRDPVASVTEIRLLILRLLYAIGQNQFSPMQHQYFLTPGQREIARLTQETLTRDLGVHVTVAQLADQYKVSPSSLKKYFAMSYGANITAYMQQYRCRKAASLLKDTDLKIGEIALQVGYTHQGKFGEVFRRVMGCSPLEYRRRTRQNGRSIFGPAPVP